MGSLLTLLSILFLISHQHVVAIQVSLSQPPESRVSSRSTSTSRKMATFDTNTLAVPPINRRMKMTPAQVEAMPIPVSGFSDTTGGAESQAPSPGGDAARDSTFEEPVDGDDGDAEAPSPDSGDFAGDSISEEAMSADGGNAEGYGGAAPAPSH